MISKPFIAGIACVIIAAPASVAAQGGYFRTAVIGETYDFATGLTFDRIRQITIPVGFSIPVGRRTAFAISSGYTAVQLTSSNGSLDQVTHGPLDTEARLSVEVIPGRFILLVTGAAPTGVIVAVDEVAVAGAISSEVIGFSAPALGTGGNVGGGFVAAVPLGSWALGFGATYRHPMQYEPIDGLTTQLRPGSEFRIRTGLEGAVARRTYIRLAAIFARRDKDQIDGVTQNGVGNRIIGYLAVNQGLGNASLTVYGLDVFRTDPQIEQTALGAAVLPRGNLFAAGANLDIPLGASTTITPTGELRFSARAPDVTTTSIETVGRALRYGLKVKQRLNDAFALVVGGSLMDGYVRNAGTRVDMTGFRASLNLEVVP
jgi:hypothetical protein